MDTQTWIGAAIGAVGLALLLTAVVRGIRGLRREAPWRQYANRPHGVPPEKEQRAALRRALNDGASDAELPELRLQAAYLLAQGQNVLSPTGLLLMFVGQFVMQPHPLKAALAGLMLLLVLPLGVMIMRNVQLARAFLKRYPETEGSRA